MYDGYLFQYLQKSISNYVSFMILSLSDFAFIDFNDSISTYRFIYVINP